MKMKNPKIMKKKLGVYPEYRYQSVFFNYFLIVNIAESYQKIYGIIRFQTSKSVDIFFCVSDTQILVTVRIVAFQKVVQISGN